ncbi:MAG: DMT family transporter [Bacteroidales bacterium]|nr:DMT family transporter [Bacteroidales bacterium]
MEKKLISYLLLIFATGCWGLSFFFTREIFNASPAPSVTALVTLRLLVVSIITIPMLLLLRQWEPLRKGDLKWFLLISLFEPFLYHLCETGAVSMVNASLVSVIVATVPLFVPFGVAAVYKQKLQPMLLLGIIISIAGVVAMMAGDLSWQANPMGIVILLGAVLASTAYMLILVKIANNYRPITITMYQNLFGLVYFIPCTLITDAEAVSNLPLYSAKTWTLILVLGIFCSLLAYTAYNHGFKQIGASKAAAFMNVSPVFTLAAVLLIGQEPFHWLKIIGMVIVIAGLFVAQYEPRKRQQVTVSKSDPSPIDLEK